MKYDAALGAHILDDAEVRALMDLSFMKVLGPEFRQANGAPKPPIQDSVAIVKLDFPHLFGKTEDPR